MSAGAKAALPPITSGARSDFLEPSKFRGHFCSPLYARHDALKLRRKHRQDEVERQEHPLSLPGRLASSHCGMRLHLVFSLHSGGLTLMKTMTDRDGQSEP